MFLFVGSLTPGHPSSTVKGEGIATFRFDPASGEVQPLHVRDGIDSPAFLATHPGRPLLLAVSEVAGWNEGTVTAYRFVV